MNIPPQDFRLAHVKQQRGIKKREDKSQKRRIEEDRRELIADC
jgi:hypothetical protein